MVTPTTSNPSEDGNIHVCWKLTATMAAWVMLIGYSLLTMALEPKAILHVNKLVLQIIGLALVIAPLGLSVILACKFTKDQKAFLLNNVYVPFFGSSIVGFFNAILNILVRHFIPVSYVGWAYITLTSAATLCYGVAIICMYWKIDVDVRFMRQSTALRIQRQRVQSSNYWPVATEDTVNTNGHADEIELQRRQLANLLHRNNYDAAPDRELIRNTFKLEIPETTNHPGDPTHYATPSSSTTPTQIPTTPYLTSRHHIIEN